MLERNIEILPGFQTAINVAYDLNSDEKVANFIPTNAALKIIEDILQSTATSSTQRANILIGAYGRGKSHIILQLISILSKNNLDGLAVFLEKVRDIDYKLYQYINAYLEGTNMLLPLIIEGNTMSLSQSFLNAINKSLEVEDISQYMPRTIYTAAYQKIIEWEETYPQTYEDFVDKLSMPIKDFKIELKDFSPEAYEEFISIYPKITAGSTFNPYISSNIIDILDELVEAISNVGYTGVFIIYDEFSKYLESNIKTTSIQDIKLLQDLAEKCNRSANRQMHLLLVSHKDIANYIDVELPKDKVDGWRGVSGRFNHKYMSNNYAQIYNVIASVIQKKESFWTNYVKENKEIFASLMDFTKNSAAYSTSETTRSTGEELCQNIVYGCYPLHPISTFLLPRLSELVAQNERTLFTFLASNSRYTLVNFMQNESSFLLTPEWIYDYFEPLFKQEPFHSETYHYYNLSQKILSDINSNLEKAIIKTITLIYMVSQFELLSPTFETISNTFSQLFGSKNVEKTINELIDERYLIYLRRSNGFLQLKESSGINIKAEIEDEKERERVESSIDSLLNDGLLENYLYPMRHNVESDIIRYFNIEFIESKKIMGINNWDYILKHTRADGVVYAIIPSSQDDVVALKKYLETEETSNRVLFILPKKYKDISETILERKATHNLLEMAIREEDKVLSEEYQLVLKDLNQVVSQYIDSYLQPSKKESVYFHQNEELLIARRSQLSEQLSLICDDLYCFSPVISNEAINKNKLSTVARNSRTRILNGLLERTLEEDLGLSGNGQDVSMMRSTLLRTGILETQQDNTGKEILIRRENIEDENVSRVIEIINSYVRESTEARSLNTLYDILTLPEHQIGLKLGVVPLFLGVVFREYIDYLVITKDQQELRITPELFNSINKQPHLYSIQLVDWDTEKEEYLQQLEKLFNDYIRVEDKQYNRFVFIYDAMNRWYMSLPQYTKNAKRKYGGYNEEVSFIVLDENTRKFMSLFAMMNQNPQEFLILSLKETFINVSGYSELTKAINQSKELLDNMINNLLATLLIDIKALFSTENTPNNAGLFTVISSWLEKLTEQTLTRVLPGLGNRILSQFKAITHNEVEWVEELCYVTTSLKVHDWNEETISIFLSELVEFKTSVEQFENKLNDDSFSSTYQLVTTDSNGQQDVRIFEKTTYGGRAKLLFNEMSNSILEMGQSVSQEEKRQVLMDILETMI